MSKSAQSATLSDFTVPDRVVIIEGAFADRGTVHLPDPDDPDEPKCGRYESRQPRNKPTAVLGDIDPEQVCDHCRGRASTGGHTGKKLATIIREIGEQDYPDGPESSTPAPSIGGNGGGSD